MKKMQSISRKCQGIVGLAAIVTSLWVVVVVTNAAPVSTDDSSDISKEGLIKEILESQSKWRNLKVVGSATIRGYDQITKELSQDLGRAKFDEMVSLDGTGRFKVAFDSVVSPWTGGSAPFFERQRTISYNGSYFADSVYRQGPPKSLYDLNRVTISGSSTNLFSVSNSYLPNDALTGLVKVFNLKSIADILANPISSSGKGMQTFTAEIRKEKQGELDVVRVTLKDGSEKLCMMETLYLVPAQGWRLLKRVRAWDLCTDGPAKRRWEYVMDDAKEISPGIWIPFRVELTRYTGEEPEEKVTIDLREIATGLNETPDMYSVPIKVGSSVTDERSGVTFTAGDSAAETTQKIRGLPALKQ